MSAIWTIARSEFVRRVKSKSFILTTLLVPLALAGFIAVTALVSMNVADVAEHDARTIAVVDETGFVLDRLLSEEDAEHTLVPGDSATIREEVLAGRYDGYVTIPKGVLTGEESASYFTVEGGGFGVSVSLQNRIRRAIRDQKMEDSNISPEVLDILDTHVAMRSVKLITEGGEAGEEAGSTAMFGGLGVAMGMIMYLALLLYGQAIFLGVMEEKRTRVVEVLISSVRPFSLLMGKVLGIGAMGLMQLACWGFALLALTTFGGTVVGMFLDPAMLGLDAAASAEEVLSASGVTLPSVQFSVFVWFVLYFLVGFLLYAGLFAAVGSMVEQAQDAQSLMLPVMLPIVLPIFFILPILESPNSSLAVVLSMIPFTAPVPMVIRLAVADLPFWEVLLSFTLLIAGALVTVWASSRIYRVGILMYGKKASLKDAIRWFRHA